MWNKQSNHFNCSIIMQTMLLLIVMTGSVSAQRTSVSDKIDPGEPFYITPSRNIDSEGEGIGTLKTPMRAATRANQ
jgi:hypothetical protein